MILPTPSGPASTEAPPIDVSFWSGTATDWLSAGGTVAATIVALGFGFAALRTAQRDRRDRDEEQRLARRAAARNNARVFTWAAAEYNPAVHGGSVWVLNDMDLPIHNANLIVYSKAMKGRKAFYLNTSFLLLAPHETRKLELSPAGFDPEMAGLPLLAMVTFNDAEGYRWTRHPSGVLTAYPWPDGEVLEPVDLIDGRVAPTEETTS